MKKILIGIVAIAMVALFGGNYYYSQQIEKRLDQIATVASQFGAQFRYRDVSISFSGDIRIDQIRFEPPGGGVINIERAAVHTGGTWGVHRLVKELRAQRIPEQLGLSLQGLELIGLQIPTGSASPLPAGSQVEPLLTQLCDKGVDGGAAPLSERTTDLRMDYRLVGQGQLMEFELVSKARQLHQLSVSMELSVGASSRRASAVAMAMNQASLLEAHVEYEDRGYIPTMIHYCERQTDLEREALIDRHLTQWQDAWKDLGLVAGDEVRQAYRRFIENPERVEMDFSPAGGLNMAEMSGDWSAHTFQSLQLSLTLNGDPVDPLDIRPMEQGEREQWRAERMAQIEAQDSAGDGEDQDGDETDTPVRKSIPVNQLRQHMNVDIVLVTGDGEHHEGRIVEVVDAHVRFRQYQRGGYIVQPIPLARIAQAYLPASDNER